MILLWIALAAALVVIGDGLVSRAQYARTTLEAAADLPVDDRTGLLDHRAFEARLLGEMKRLDRMPGHGLWLSVWVTSAGDADAFGRAAYATTEFPDMAFRMDDTTFCFARVTDGVELPDDRIAHLTEIAAPFTVRRGDVQYAPGSGVGPRTLAILARSRALDGGGV